MSTKVQVTRPTKIELARLKRRMRLATRIQKIVKDRLSILIMEFLQTVKECASAKEKLLADFKEAYKALSVTTGYHGYAFLEKELLASEMAFKINTITRNVAGVRLPVFETEEMDALSFSVRNTADTSSLIDNSVTLSRKCLKAIIELAELQNSLELLGAEINKVKRINNALEHIVIPGLDATIKYLTMKFEERDREEIARLKYVKLLIEQREAYAY
ncbi:MAG: V-type ATP synthase subunit D [Deltaproteobacteria bacterium]|nr:V-type ATP synthase subunit D [Deltaproteobacteria bacterium]MBW2594642.1 V-type ATP synthase subunit D [Deltaproteobacteria bacterium]MBW2649508.1 V-type ATP synthase subunit D [Deltaproteobacteria bacterium]